MTKDPQMPDVIVLGATFTGLGVVHALAEEGLSSWVCDARRDAAAFSRHARFWRTPDPRDDPDGMIESLLALLDRFDQPPILLPSDDHHMLHCAIHRDRLAGRAVLCGAEADTVELILDKDRFSAWAIDGGLSAPKSASFTEFDRSRPFSFPVAVKPNHQSMSVGEGGKRFVMGARFLRVDDAETWDSLAQRDDIDPEGYVVQEYVQGTSADMYSIGIYADESHEIKALFVGRKLRGFPALYGDTKLGQNDVVPATVIDEIRTAVRSLRYKGIAEFEYKRDSTTGAYRLIEINPRAWSWIAITMASPANIPWIAVQDLAGRATEPRTVNENPGRLKYVRALADLFNVLVRYRGDYPSWAGSPVGWYKSLRAKRLIVAEWSQVDVGVFVWSLGWLVARTLAITFRSKT